MWILHCRLHIILVMCCTTLTQEPHWSLYMPWHGPCYPGCLCHPSPGASPRRRVPHQTEPQCTSCTPPERQLIKRISWCSIQADYNINTYQYISTFLSLCKIESRLNRVARWNMIDGRHHCAQSVKKCNHRESSVPLQFWWLLQALQAPRHSKPPKKHLVHAPKGCQPSVQVSSQRNPNDTAAQLHPTERSRPS